MFLLPTTAGECPIFCDNDQVTLRHVDFPQEGRVVECEAMHYHVEFPQGVQRVEVTSLRLVDGELAAKRATIFFAAMEMQGNILKMKPSLVLTDAVRVYN